MLALWINLFLFITHKKEEWNKFSLNTSVTLFVLSKLFKIADKYSCVQFELSSNYSRGVNVSSILGKFHMDFLSSVCA